MSHFAQGSHLQELCYYYYYYYVGPQVPLESLVLSSCSFITKALLKNGGYPLLFGQATSKPMGFQVCFSRAEVLEAKSQLEAVGKRTLAA